MLEFARRRFALDKIDPTTGKSRLQTLQDIRKQTGVVRRELRDLPLAPPETEYLWNWFLDLSARRQAGFSINALAWADIHAYFTLKRLSPEPWEVDTLCLLDSVYLEAQAKDSNAPVANATGLGSQVTGKRSADGSR